MKNVGLFRGRVGLSRFRMPNSDDDDVCLAKLRNFGPVWHCLPPHSSLVFGPSLPFSLFLVSQFSAWSILRTAHPLKWRKREKENFEYSTSLALLVICIRKRGGGLGRQPGSRSDICREYRCQFYLSPKMLEWRVETHL